TKLQNLKEISGNTRAEFFDPVPIVPFRVQLPVFLKICVLQVIGHWISQLNLQLLKSRFAIGLWIELIQSSKRFADSHWSYSFRQRRKIEVIARRITTENQHAFDAKQFLLSRHYQSHTTDIDFLYLERLFANHLPHTCFNPIEA